MPEETANLDARMLQQLLAAVGAHLQAEGHRASIVVVGGAALCLRGWVHRTTHDVDVIATATDDTGNELSPPRFSGPLKAAARRVARDYNLADDWLNDAIGKQWKTGLPGGMSSDIDWRQFHGLRVGLVGRQTLITLKLIAAVDQWPASVHLQDLLTLSPSIEELERSRAWVVKQDTAPEFPAMVERVITHVGHR